MTTSSPRPRVLVVQNDATDPLALLADWWAEVGIDVVEIRADDGEFVPDALPEGFDGLVLLGGSMSAWEDEVAPWLPNERAMVARAVDDGTPVLGVCLGGQIITIACGGTVERAGQGEVGIVELQLSEDVANDPIFSALPASPAVAEFHIDEMKVLPKGAVVLASTDVCANQAYRLGERAWALQFHPEIDAAIMGIWADGEPEIAQRCGMSPGQAQAITAARQDELVATWRPFAHAWADVVRSAAAE